MNRRFSFAAFAGLLTAALVFTSAVFAPGMSPPVYTDKVDKIDPSVDNALIKSDGVGGAIQDGVLILFDNGDLNNTGTSSVFKTEDKTGATSSVSISHETGNITGVSAAGVSGDITQETGATIDGNSGDLKRIAGTPTGTGTRGDIEDEANNILFAPDTDFGISLAIDKDFRIDDGTNEFFKAWYTATGASYVGTALVGNVTYPWAVHLVTAYSNADLAGTMFFSTPAKMATLSAAGFVGHWDSNPDGLTIYSSDGTLALVTLNSNISSSGISDHIIIQTGISTTTDQSGSINIETGVQSNAGDYYSGAITLETGRTETAGDSGPILITSGNAADDSGDITIQTGTAGGSRGDVIIDSPQWSVDASGVILGYKKLNAQVATPYLATAADEIITMNVAGASVVNLPTAVGITGKVYTIKRLSAAGPNAVAVTPNGGETIDGVSPVNLNAVNQSVTIISNGTNWLKI